MADRMAPDLSRRLAAAVQGLDLETRWQLVDDVEQVGPDAPGDELTFDALPEALQERIVKAEAA